MNMNKKELIEFLKENIKIDINVGNEYESDGVGISVNLSIKTENGEYETISYDNDWFYV